MRAYGKSIAAVVVVVLLALQKILVPGHEHWTSIDTWTLVVAALGAVTVYVVPNLSTTSAAYAKQIVASFTAVAELALQFGGGIHGAEWVTVALAVAGALGISIAPHESTAPNVARSSYFSQ
jgi:hypothetical protein